jgi:hypothetical protein
MFGKLNNLFKKGGSPAAAKNPCEIDELVNALSGRDKKFRLRPDEIAPIAFGLGGCLATDRIVVDGRPVGYMRRERPINPDDSGWRFFAGDETPEYMAVNTHHGVYDVNTIANYDAAILPFIDSEIGSEFERDDADNDFILVE